MNVQLSETQEMLRASAREFLAESCPPALVRAMRDDERGYSPEVWNAMAELGWPGLSLPERYGGSGMSFLDLCLLQEELGRACAPTPFAAAAVAGLVIAQYASDSQRARLLPGIATGDSLVVPALQVRRDSHGFKEPPVATFSGGGLVLSGGLDFVPWAGSAALILCVAATGSSGEDVRLVVVPASAAGISLTALHNVGPDRLWRLDLNSVEVDADAVIEDSGADAIATAFALMDTAQCCDIVGSLQHVLEATVSYAKDRAQFGRSIGSFQVLQHYCADMHVMLEGLRMSTYAAAWSLSEGGDGVRSAALAAAYSQRAVPQILNLAHQIHGAMGVTREHDLHLYTTRATPPGHDLVAAHGYPEMVLTR